MSPEEGPLTPDRIAAGIQYYIRKLSEATDAYSVASDKKAETKAELQIQEAKSRTYFRSEVTKDWERRPTEQQVEDYCTIECEEELKAKLHAEAREEALKISVRSLQSRLDGTRSLGASLRSNLD
jgi:hypothetical protein